MIAVHIYDTLEYTTVTHLDCVVAKLDKGNGDYLEFLVDVLLGLGHKVECE